MSPPTTVPIIGIGIKTCPIIAPDTADPSEVPVYITTLYTGAIFLSGAWIDSWVASALLPKPPTFRNSSIDGIYKIKCCMHPLTTAFSPNL